ncbi:MAG: DUF2277 domain-containing protein [Acidimicrobiales bacterium]
MCRSIVRLRVPAGKEVPPPGAEETRAAAEQFIRKVAGTRSPSKANEVAFERAVDEIAGSVQRLLSGWVDPSRASATRVDDHHVAGSVMGH